MRKHRGDKMCQATEILTLTDCARAAAAKAGRMIEYRIVRDMCVLGWIIRDVWLWIVDCECFYILLKRMRSYERVCW